MAKIVIVDLGTGNLRSVSKAVTYVSAKSEVEISADAQAISEADYLILPGQGAIGTWFSQLNANNNLKSAVLKRLEDGPVLGICLGLQALYADSEESGGVKGLGLLSGQVKHFMSHPAHQKFKNKPTRLKIPHMGWNQVKQRNDHPMWHGIDDNEWFYFVHSYYVQSNDIIQIAGECEYGNRFIAAASKKNVFATQFHPEKSQQAGLKLLKNFINWNGSL